MNPLFDNTSGPRKPKDPGYVLARQTKIVEPLKNYSGSEEETPKDPNQKAAIELIHKKLDAIYEDEPDAKEEIKEAEAAPKRSAHQQVMHELSNSGMSLAEIQKAWHEYYANLDNKGKHEVWREFYANSNGQPTPAGTAYKKAANKHTAAVAEHKQQATQKAEAIEPQPELQLHPTAETDNQHRVVVAEHQTMTEAPVADKNPVKSTRAKRGANALRKHVVEKVKLSAAQQEKAKQHAHSLLFGIGSGALVIVIFLFSFFNEMIIAPFIQPSRAVSETPIILTSNSVAVSENPEVIIPKINVQIPVDYTQKSVQEDDFQASLENGIVHYASINMPGE